MRRRHLPRKLVAALAALALALAAAGAAQAAITTATNDAAGATAVANAMAADTDEVVGAVWTAHPGDGPNGTADAPISSFPTHGTTFSLLTTGNVQFADDPNSEGNKSQANGGLPPPGRGDTAFDVSTLQITLDAPAGSNCLTFDFQFYSEEYPEWVNTQYNDAFIAELDVSTWTTSGSTITAANNFAFDPSGNVISINAAGNTSMTAGNAAGTTYDGATPLLAASTQITPGLHNLYLSIFDQGDQIFDSAVFLDNLRIGFVPNPAVNCVPGAQPVAFQMTLEPAADENPVGTPHTVTATLTDETGAPVEGAEIEFDVSGANTASGVGVTDATGQATFTYTGTSTGDDIVSACYNADASTDGSCEAVASATKRWVIGAPASLTLAPEEAVNVVDSEHCVTATVADAAGNPTPDVTVRFSVTGSVTTGGAATTDANGQATFCYDGPALPGADAISAYADTDADETQDADEPGDTAAKQWVLPATTEGCKVTYGGRITAANGDKGTFGGVAKAPPGKAPKGQEQYRDHGPAQAMNVHSIDVQALTCNAAGTRATIFGQATVDGSGAFDYRIDLKDLGEPGSSDRYRIRLGNGYDSGAKLLRRGNVQIHS